MNIILLFIAFTSGAFAQTKQVIYFGGYGASRAQMNCWERGAGPNFSGIEYPAGAGADRESVVRIGAAVIRAVVAEIDSHPQTQYVVAGHSSGAALSNEVAARVRNPAQIELINLDGFAPSRLLQSRVRSTCWYAVNRQGLRSRNASSMVANCGRSAAYTSTTCRTAWCLHFSLVNTAVPPNLGSGNFKTRGYEGCATNLAPF